jgi:hypothetical protein
MPSVVAGIPRLSHGPAAELPDAPDGHELARGSPWEVLMVEHSKKPGDDRDRNEKQATEPVPRKELSDYEDLSRRSRDLQREHEAGGHGTSQPPDADTPLLHPKHPPQKDE